MATQGEDVDVLDGATVSLMIPIHAAPPLGQWHSLLFCEAFILSIERLSV
jgi:hypothetical protein